MRGKPREEAEGARFVRSRFVYGRRAKCKGRRAAKVSGERPAPDLAWRYVTASRQYKLLDCTATNCPGPPLFWNLSGRVGVCLHSLLWKEKPSPCGGCGARGTKKGQVRNRRQVRECSKTGVEYGSQQSTVRGTWGDRSGHQLRKPKRANLNIETIALATCVSLANSAESSG